MNRKQIAAAVTGAVLTLTVLVVGVIFATPGKKVSEVPLGNGEFLVTAEIHYPAWSVVLLALVVLGTIAAVFKLRDQHRS